MIDLLRSNRLFRERVRAKETLIGVFIKTFDLGVVESIAVSTNLDFVVLDLEHAPCDSQQLSACILAARSQALPVIIRLGNTADFSIAGSLDLGASGVMFPRIDSAEAVQNLLKSTKFQGGRRGFSLSHRAASFGGASREEFISASDKAVLTAAQIETLPAVKASGEIAAIDDLDLIFVGPADLAVALADAPDAACGVDDAIHLVAVNASNKRKALGIYCSSVFEVDEYLRMGFTFFIVSTDQALMISAANKVVSEFRQRGKQR
jgi:2-keto-3-deoxy-L-rhamnonate aldolase RhmA